MIKNVNYTISPVIRQVFLHWGCEQVENDLLKFGVVNKLKMIY